MVVTIDTNTKTTERRFSKDTRCLIDMLNILNSDLLIDMDQIKLWDGEEINSFHNQSNLR